MKNRTLYFVHFGSTYNVFHTDYHAAAFARALALNGTPFHIVGP